MTNIFENAYFGKSYKTRDGRKAIYFINNQCIVEKELAIHSYCSNGDYSVHGVECGLDIVSEWQEEINEEVLCETALNFVVDFLNKNEMCLVPYKNYNEIGDGTWNNNQFNCNDLTEAYEAGYRKALGQ